MTYQTLTQWAENNNTTFELAVVLNKVAKDCNESIDVVSQNNDEDFVESAVNETFCKFPSVFEITWNGLIFSRF